MKEFFSYMSGIGVYDFPILYFLLRSFIILFFITVIIVYIYDKYIQRKNQLLINYPLIGHLRYLFYALRDPMRQYFGDEKFYESFDKIKWVYESAENKVAYASFSPGQPQKSARISIKNSNIVLNNDEVDDTFQVTFGSNIKHPFTTSSVLGRSAMSDGAISPEGTRAFAKGAYLGNFPINTGEGGLTSNFLYTHKYTRKCKYFETKEGTYFAKSIYRLIALILNAKIAQNVYKHMVIHSSFEDSYLFDKDALVCYRVDWKAPLEEFPSNVPKDIPDIVFQIGSGLYGVRDKNGEFDKDMYKKVMRFSKMTEIKIAQGAKQTGGKLLASKVTKTIAYYRGVKPHKDLFSPNRFPYAKTLEDLFDFIGKLKKISQKPVGIKIVISSKEGFSEYARLIKKRVDLNDNSYPDFITVDGGDGGSGAAPLSMMMSVGMIIQKALYIADSTLKETGCRDNIKLIASEKVLTPDDAVVLLALGADFVGIARAFMMSAGCIRARECAGANGRSCPVGLATQDMSKRASFLVEKKSYNIANYHEQMIKGIKQLFAIMGVKKLKDLNQSYLIFKDHTGKTYMNISNYFKEALV